MAVFEGDESNGESRKKKQNTLNTSKPTSVHEPSLTASSLFKTCGDQGFQWSTVISTGWFIEIQKVARLRPSRG